MSDSKNEPDAPPSPHDIHRVIRTEGEEQLERHGGALALSGLAAGLSMGFSFLGMALLEARLPEGAPWRPLIGGFGYSLGFLIVILGRQQLYTESTLTPVLPVLTDRSLAKFGKLLRFWALVLGANLFGTWIFAWAIAHETVFLPATWNTLLEISALTVQEPFWIVAFKAMLAGWLIALMVWLLPSAGPAKMPIIIMITYFVAIGQFSHSIAGSVEATFTVLAGGHTWHDYVFAFLIPTVLGNTVGGVALCAILNHAPLATET